MKKDLEERLALEFAFNAKDAGSDYQIVTSERKLLAFIRELESSWKARAEGMVEAERERCRLAVSEQLAFNAQGFRSRVSKASRWADDLLTQALNAIKKPDIDRFNARRVVERVKKGLG